MTCMEVDGLKRGLFKVVLPEELETGAWLLNCYLVCNTVEEFGYL